MTAKEQLKIEVIACAESIEEAARGDYECVAEYFDDTLDVEFFIGRNGEYRGARITLALGGPGIFFDTREGWVKGYWGSDYAEYYVKSFAVDSVDEYFAEMWNCRF